MLKLFGRAGKVFNSNGDGFGFQISWDTED